MSSGWEKEGCIKCELIGGKSRWYWNTFSNHFFKFLAVHYTHINISFVANVDYPHVKNLSKLSEHYHTFCIRDHTRIGSARASFKDLITVHMRKHSSRYFDRGLAKASFGHSKSWPRVRTVQTNSGSRWESFFLVQTVNRSCVSTNLPRLPFFATLLD